MKNLIVKIYVEFNNSSEIEELKSHFDFVELEYEKVIKYFQIRWLSLFQAIEQLSSWPAKNIFSRIRQKGLS